MKPATWALLIGAALILVGTGGAILMPDWKQKGAKYLPLLNAAEDQFGIPRDLLARQAYEESHFRDDIVNGDTISPAGAVGIMQIVPHWHPDISVADLKDPAKAIPYAARFMRQLFDEFGSWSLALAAYNAGPGNVQKYGNTVPPFAETQSYVADIIRDVNAGGGMVT